MLIYGGMTETGADDSLWSFNVTSLRWSKVCTNVKCAFIVLWSFVEEGDFSGRIPDALRKRAPPVSRFSALLNDVLMLSSRSCALLSQVRVQEHDLRKLYHKREV